MTPGAVVDLGTCWHLARPWYSDRLDQDWRPKSAERMEELFAAAGLSGDFWSISSF